MPADEIWSDRFWQNLSEGGVVLDPPAAPLARQERQEESLAIRPPVVAVLGLELILLLVYTLLRR